MRTRAFPALVDAGKKVDTPRAALKVGVGETVFKLMMGADEIVGDDGMDGDDGLEGVYDTVLGLYGSTGVSVLSVSLSPSSMISAVVSLSVGARLFNSSPLTVRMLRHPASAPGAPRRSPPGSGPIRFLLERVSIILWVSRATLATPVISHSCVRPPRD